MRTLKSFQNIALKYFFLASITALSVFIIYISITIYAQSQRPFIIESLESKTVNGGSVFNRIQYISEKGQDTWLMQQSHKGYNSEFNTWDRLAIVVDKSKAPYQAKFYQFKAGELKLASENERVPFKVRCFMCHANGPRAIRADSNSQTISLSFNKKIYIEYLNLKIKLYGKIVPTEGQGSPEAPFQSSLSLLHKKLKLASCIQCHSDEGIRNSLTLEHLTTAKFLIQNNQMPPYPYKISEEDRRKVQSLFQQ